MLLDKEKKAVHVLEAAILCRCFHTEILGAFVCHDKSKMMVMDNLISNYLNLISGWLLFEEENAVTVFNRFFFSFEAQILSQSQKTGLRLSLPGFCAFCGPQGLSPVKPF